MTREKGVVLRIKNSHLIGTSIFQHLMIDDIVVVPEEEQDRFWESYRNNEMDWEVVFDFPACRCKVVALFDAMSFSKTGKAIIEELTKLTGLIPDIVME